ncbi:Tc toxin subunit A-related protein [Micromonospora aurantiaca (nom. illeg.)]|uniref:Tc toxin subunit A-related protein n=1 Tax=Micromonospora aurantiaca (nom. illeg.) TaxID=47850 RepID=UPI0033CF2BA4
MRLAGRNLHAGLTGDDVTTLHRALLALGLAIPADEFDHGVFGVATADAVARFQRDHGLADTAIVDETTAAALGAAVPGRSPATGPAGRIPDGLGDGDVTLVHRALDALGIDVDPSEREKGRLGATTREAVARLQTLLGMASTGDLDAATISLARHTVERLGGDAGPGVAAPGANDSLVDGAVFDANGFPMAEVTVVVLRRRLRDETELGRATTDADGQYAVGYQTPPDVVSKGTGGIDLQVDVLGADGRRLFRSAVRHRADTRVRIDLPLGGERRTEPSELDRLGGAVTKLLGSLRADEIVENDQHQDLTYLAESSGFEREQVATYSVAVRLAGQTGLPPELFYALLRMDVPANASIAVLADMSDGTDLDRNATRLLTALARTAAATRAQAVRAALDAGIVTPGYAQRVTQDLDALDKLAATARLASPSGVNKTPLGTVLTAAGIATAKQERFSALSHESAVPGEQFWKDLAANPDFTPAEVDTLRFATVVSDATRGYMPLVTRLLARRRDGQLAGTRDLAKLSAAAWKAMLLDTAGGPPIGVPPNMRVADPAQGADVYAQVLERNFERMHPTTAFGARLADDSASPLTAKAAVVTFIDEQPAFSLRRSDVDRYLKDHPAAVRSAERAAVREALLTSQRLVKVAGRYAIAKPLLADRIHSAQQVYAMGRSAFTQRYAGHPDIGPTEAARVFRTAEQTYGVALTYAMNLNAQLVGVGPAAAQTPVPAIADDFPNLQSLFGSLDMCACQECRSVLSPAAYLVDLLHFLDKRKFGASSLKNVLLNRRPDLAQIELSCANTNTVLPYLDLVNELLEDAVAPPTNPSAAARARQTTLSTDELNANPQYVNDAAYAKLAAAVFPWGLPFDLPLTEARTYLRLLDTDRVELMRALTPPAAPGSAPTAAAAAEGLGLSPTQADIVTAGPLVAGRKPWEFWGLAENGNAVRDPVDASIVVSGSWLEVLSRIRILLDRAGLSYVEFTRLLNTRFVNPTGTVTLVCDPPDTCDLAKTRVVGLTADVLNRMHRFVRLTRALGWSLYDTDGAVAALGGTLASASLRQLYAVRAAARRFTLDPLVAVSLLGRIDTRDVPPLPGDDPQRSLYSILFANRTVLNPVDPVFTLDAAGTEIAAIASGPKLTEHRPALVAAFQVADEDLVIAIDAFTDGALNLANLATLHRCAVLARGLGLTMREFVAMRALAERTLPAPPFAEPLNPFDAARPELLAEFCAEVDRVRRSGFGVAELSYLLRHVGEGFAPDEVAVGTLLRSIRDRLATLAAEHVPAEDPRGSIVRQRLASLLPAADVDAVTAVLSGATALSEDAQRSVIATALGALVDVPAVQKALVGSAALRPGQSRYEYLLVRLVEHARRTLGSSVVVQELADALALPTAIIATLVSDWFRGLDDRASSLLADLLLLPTITRDAALADSPIRPSEPGFGGYFVAYERLAKVARLVAASGLSADETAWLRPHGVAAHWLDPTTLPVQPAKDPEGRYAGWRRLTDATSVRAVLGGKPIVALLESARTGATKQAYLQALADRTGWLPQSLRVLAGDPASAADRGLLDLGYPQDFGTEVALTRLAAAFAQLDRLGLGAAEVAGWLGATVTAAQARAIRQSVKARYSAQQWPRVAKPPRDALRERQRDALLGYLLAHPPAAVTRWHDPDDVYARYLIDVQMSACQGTSRIVQAASAVQLFVQRCLLNLEPGIVIDTAVDPDWAQWRWMNRYRVWEANRQVFLYPENWIQPELRTEKSPLFKQLETDLQRGEVTTGRAEDAFRGYLEQLNTVSRLDVVGMYRESSSPTRLHIIARKAGSPPSYYHRIWVDSSRWTAWTKIDLDITGTHVLPVVVRGRLHLFWGVISRRSNHEQPLPAMQMSTSQPPPPGTHIEVKLAYSEFKDGTWLPAETTHQAVVFDGMVQSKGVNLRSAQYGAGQLYINVFNNGFHRGQFVFQGIGNPVEVFSTYDLDALRDVSLETVGTGVLPTARRLDRILVPTNTAREGMAMVPVAQTMYSVTRPRTSPMNVSAYLDGELQSLQVLANADRYRLIVPHQQHQFDSSLPFFYADQRRQYFVIPTFYYPIGNGYYTATPPPSGYTPYSFVRYRFVPFHHEYVPLFLRRLHAGGVDALFDRRLQTEPAKLNDQSAFDFLSYYVSNMAQPPFPADGVDFEPDAGYAVYNWELFFHTPFQIAESLRRNQRFAEAKRWYEYVFNPTSTTSEPAPQRFWVTKPFYRMQDEHYWHQAIQQLMQAVHDRDPQAELQVAAWRNSPFDPHAVAALRPVSYQRAIVMRYVDNLIEWGDQLFRQDTRESVNEATQLYVLAADLLGPRPELVPRDQGAPSTYADLAGSLDDFSNAVTAAENAIAPVGATSTTVSAGAPPLPVLRGLYFTVPPNPQLLRYWDVVADRLFKVRHCLNLDGVSRPLALFAPAIDPALLVQAVSAGLDLSSMADDTGAALPPYRFRTILREAVELTEYVRGLGNQLSVALQQRDADGLERLRAGAERILQTRLRGLYDQQVTETDEALTVIDRQRDVVAVRQTYYGTRRDELTSSREAAALATQEDSIVAQAIGAGLDAGAAVAHLVPDVQFGASGVGGTPHATVRFGGSNVAGALGSLSAVAKVATAVLQTRAQMSTATAGYERRRDEWRFQHDQSIRELEHLAAQQVAATVRQGIARTNRTNHDLVVENAEAVEEHLRSRFTNAELFEWMIGQTSATYFQAYQLAYTVARRAEQCLRHELGTPNTSYIQFGYWDSLRKGLLAGDRLLHHLRRMESAFYTDHVRELELVKHVSLLNLDPYALVQLRATGECVVSVPELLFDLDNPGHYQRRLKQVGVSVPCVAGPYAGVPLTLTLLDNHVRTTTGVSPQYVRNAGDDPRFADDLGGVDAIVTSSGQNDSGMFEARLDDERYLPFERAGAISTWRLRLNPVYPQFDIRTITDVVLHVRYTARDGGAVLAEQARTAVRAHLNTVALAESRTGLYRLISARQQHSAAWQRFLHPGEGEDQVLTIPTPADDFAFFTRGLDLTATEVDVLSKLDGTEYELVLGRPGGPDVVTAIRPDSTLNGLHHVGTTLTPPAHLGRAPAEVPDPRWTLRLRRAGVPDFRSLTPAEIEDLVLLIKYRVAQ